MKFNWGTGILIFLIVFVLANVVFMVFAFRQEVNLVEENYYEKGVDYSEQMEVIERSKVFEADVEVNQEDGDLFVRFNEHLSSSIDSGKIVLYRPSSKKYDLPIILKPKMEQFSVLRENMIRGRYVIKMDWYSEGLRYELNVPTSIQ